MSLSTVLEEIKKLKPVADQDVYAGPRETFAGREGLKRNATERLKTLKENYIDELRRSSVFIVVSGSAKEQFAELAQGEFKCFTVDPEAFYKDLANRIPQELYTNRTPAANLFEIVGRHLEDKANEMQILEYPQLIMKEQYLVAVNGKEDFVELIKRAVNEQVGSEIVGLNAIRSIADKAVEASHSSRLTPIVMCTNDEKLALDLNSTLGRIGSRTFLVAAGKGAKVLRSTEGAFTVKEVSKESVEKVLTNVSQLCKIQ